MCFTLMLVISVIVLPSRTLESDTHTHRQTFDYSGFQRTCKKKWRKTTNEPVISIQIPIKSMRMCGFSSLFFCKFSENRCTVTLCACCACAAEKTSVLPIAIASLEMNNIWEWPAGPPIGKSSSCLPFANSNQKEHIASHVASYCVSEICLCQ
jgi:hypothetical protein